MGTQSQRQEGCDGGETDRRHAWIFGPSRCQELLQLLDIDLEWRMHIVSDGERRRAQILLGLLNPFDVLLLDEVTVDLDVLVRADFLKFLKSETESRGATILYAVSKCVLTCLLNHPVLV